MMIQTEIPRELHKLPLPERLSIVEEALRLIREDIEQEKGQQYAPAGTERQLADAAEALRIDYSTDSELTAFTALDSEDFHA